ARPQAALATERKGMATGKARYSELFPGPTGDTQYQFDKGDVIAFEDFAKRFIENTMGKETVDEIAPGPMPAGSRPIHLVMGEILNKTTGRRLSGKWNPETGTLTLNP